MTLWFCICQIVYVKNAQCQSGGRVRRLRNRCGCLYLAIVLDVWSRRIVGWSIAEEMTADLVLAALDMALSQRKPAEVIHHSDQGSQYTSIAFGERCKKMGVKPSMGSVGDAYDNAMAESFFASLECELIDRRSFQTKTEARLACFTWIRTAGTSGCLRYGALRNLDKPLCCRRKRPTRAGDDGYGALDHRRCKRNGHQRRTVEHG